jgi:hypothetical protein
VSRRIWACELRTNETCHYTKRSDQHVRAHHMWKPDTASLQQLVALLEQTQQPSADQRQLLDQLDAHKGNADFNNYLAYLFAHANDASEVVRFFYVFSCLNDLMVFYECAKGNVLDGKSLERLWS